jgi:peptide chain release factor subunit 1
MPAQASLQENQITPALLERLARLEAPAEAYVISVYLDLDPSETLAIPRARRTQITSLIDEAKRLAAGEPELPHEQRMRLRADIERVRELLERQLVDGPLAEGALGLAVFACEAAALLEAVRLPRPVRSRVALGRRPLIQPLAEIGPPQPWAVLLCDGDDARLLESSDGRLVELERFSDELRRRAGHGVWAPERTDAPLPEDELAHVRRAAALLEEKARKHGYQRIALGADERIYGEIERRLPDDLRRRLIGRFDVDADAASPAEVRARVEPLLRAAEQERRAAALAQLDEQGVCGPDATLSALYERRVRLLLLHEGRELPGALCPSCGRAAAVGGRCPLDGAWMRSEANVLDWAAARAIDQGAEILALPDGLERCGGVGALLRF